MTVQTLAEMTQAEFKFMLEAIVESAVERKLTASSRRLQNLMPHSGHIHYQRQI